MKNIILLILIINISWTAVAGTCSTILCDAKIDILYVHENTNIYVQPAADTSTLNCTLSQSSMVLEKSNTMQQEMYSLLLSAKLADKEVRLRIEESSNICRIMYVQLRP